MHDGYDEATLFNLMDMDGGPLSRTVTLTYVPDTDTINIGDLGHTYSESELIADPYGTAIAAICAVLTDALDDGVNGAMNDVEFATLEAVARLLVDRDPALSDAIQPRMG
jgi:hypothetical protein